jgi:hypothetical protein
VFCRSEPALISFQVHCTSSVELGKASSLASTTMHDLFSARRTASHRDSVLPCSPFSPFSDRFFGSCLQPGFVPGAEISPATFAVETQATRVGPSAYSPLQTEASGGYRSLSCWRAKQAPGRGTQLLTRSEASYFSVASHEFWPSEFGTEGFLMKKSAFLALGATNLCESFGELLLYFA